MCIRDRVNTLEGVMSDEAYLILVCGLFGSIIALLTASKGHFGFAKIVSKICNSERKTLFTTFILGVIIFIDDYLNVLSIGTAMKKVYDKVKVPREALAYLLDSTGSPVCVMFPFSSWAAYFGAIFFAQESVQALGAKTWMGAYIKAIPFCIYPIVALLIVILFSAGVFPKLGGMKKAYDCLLYTSNFYDAVYSPVILILNAVVVAVVMLFSASGNAKVLTLFGMSAGTAVAVINYISQIFSPVESLGMEIQTIQSAIAGVRRINEFFELPVLDNNEELQAEKTFDSKNDTPYVQFNDVTFGYEADHTVIADKTFVVNRGEQVTLSGRTGAGKSTIFKLLLGLYKPQKGSILINDMNSAAIPDNRKRKIFGYVEQSFHMVPGTIKDQITLYDKSISDEAVIKAAKLTGLHDTIMNFENGYDTQCTQAVSYTHLLPWH